MAPWRPVGVAAALFVLVGLVASPPSVAAATPIVSATLAPSVAVAVDGTTVTWTSTVTPVSGTSTNLGLQMQSQQWYMVSVGGSFVPAGGTCTRAPDCSVDGRTGDPSWTFATLAAPVTITFTTLVNSGRPVTLFITSTGVGCAGACPPTATVAIPALTAGIAYTTSGAILTGSTLHVTVTGTTNAGPLDADVQGKLSVGLSAPTNINPSSAIFSPPPYDYVDDGTTLNKTQTLRFDIQVTASAGSDVTLAAHVYPVNSKYGSASKSIKIHVGPVATPTPTTTPMPTTTPGPTPTPAAGQIPRPTPTPTSGRGRPTSSPSALPVSVTQHSASPLPSTGSSSPSPSASDTFAASSGSPIEVALVESAGTTATTVPATAATAQGPGSPEVPVAVIAGVAVLAVVSGISMAAIRRAHAGRS